MQNSVYMICELCSRVGSLQSLTLMKDELNSSPPLQIVPGVKDVRTTLANAIAEAQEGGSSQAPESDAPAGMSERQSIGGSTTPGSLQSSQPPFGTYRPRSIRRLMSEKSMTRKRMTNGGCNGTVLNDENANIRLACILLAITSRL